MSFPKGADEGKREPISQEVIVLSGPFFGPAPSLCLRVGNRVLTLVQSAPGEDRYQPLPVSECKNLGDLVYVEAQKPDLVVRVGVARFPMVDASGVPTLPPIL